MKKVLARISTSLSPRGYRKRGLRFWRIEQGTYRLVDVQRGRHGEYFYINLGVHPVGMPQLLVGKVSIDNNPRIEDCILQARLSDAMGLPSGYLETIYTSDRGDVESALALVDEQVESWFDHWAKLETLANSEEAKVLPQLSVVPLLRYKALWMLRAYCFFELGEQDSAADALNRFVQEDSGAYDLRSVETWLASRLSKPYNQIRRSLQAE